jgi:hypothetical protein
MTQNRYAGPEKRRSPRHNRRFKVTLEYEGKTHDIRTIDISRHGVMIQRRNPPSIGTHVWLTITMRDETSMFKGIVIRHAISLVSGTKTNSVGIDIISPGYDEFVKDKITIA